MLRARLVILAGALLYSAWILAPAMGSRLSFLSSYVSEVAATGQPYADFFRAADLLAGSCFVVGAALGWRAARPSSILARAALGGVIVLGAGTMADALLPLSCTPTADAACAVREESGAVPFAHVAHAFSSGVAGTGAVIAVLGWAAWLRRTRPDGAPPAPPRTVAALVVGAAYLVATVWTLAAMAVPDPSLHLGLAQRLQIAGITAWLVLVSLPPPAARP